MGGGVYRLGRLKGRAVVTWTEAGVRRRFRLAPGLSPAETKAAFERFVRDRARLAVGSAATVAELARLWLEDRASDGKSTAKQSVSMKALLPHFGPLRPADIGKKECRDFERARIEQGRAIGTVWTDLTVLRACLRWAARETLIEAAPHITLPPQPAPKDRHLTREEAGRLIEACCMPHVRLFVILALATAGRHRAVLGLTWDRVDFAGGRIDLRDPDRPVTNKRRQLVPMAAMARAALSEAQSGALSSYVIEWGARPVASIRKGFEEACRRAGLEDVTPHTLRHTAAVWMAEAGVRMEQIAEYLGHTDVRTTYRVYARYSPTALAGAAEVVNLDLRRRA
jgi:integrase